MREPHPEVNVAGEEARVGFRTQWGEVGWPEKEVKGELWELEVGVPCPGPSGGLGRTLRRSAFPVSPLGSFTSFLLKCEFTYKFTILKV